MRVDKIYIHIPDSPMNKGGKELLIPKSGRKSKLQGFKGSKLVKNATKDIYQPGACRGVRCEAAFSATFSATPNFEVPQR